jgi:hypothetical protein
MLDNMIHDDKTVFVTLCDEKYFNRAKNTIHQLRNYGKWGGTIILISVDFNLDDKFKLKYNVTEKQFPIIDKSSLILKIGNGFTDGDKREITKLTQWEKLHVFDIYFNNWERVVFLDAGLNVFDSVEYLLALDYKNGFLCGSDRGDGIIKHNNNEFKCQITKDRPEIFNVLIKDFGSDFLNSEYFLNCMWVYDTNILDIIKKEEFIETMNLYPLFKTNEMGVMNLILNFKYKLWIPFPEKIKNGKYLFDWCELNRPGTNWTQYSFIKYSTTYNEYFL